MALTYSEMIPLGKKAPTFDLWGIDKKRYNLENFTQDIIVVMFLCKHCPYVKAIQNRIGKLSQSYSGKPVQFIAICSNDVRDYPEDSPENLLIQSKEAGFQFPYLVDETQEVAKAYGAVATPDFFVFDRERKLRYRGRFDNSWKDESKVTQQDLKSAIDQMLAGKPVSENQMPSMGCSIKWSRI